MQKFAQSLLHYRRRTNQQRSRKKRSDSNSRKFFFLGIDIGGYRVRIALANNSHAILYTSEFLMSDARSEVSNMAFLIGHVRRFLAHNDHPASLISAIGIGVTGIVDSRKQVILNIPNSENSWDNLELPRALQEEFGCPVFLDEGGRTLVLAEKLLGKAKDVNDFIIVHSAFGVVAGIMTNGVIVRGRKMQEDYSAILRRIQTGRAAFAVIMAVLKT